MSEGLAVVVVDDGPVTPQLQLRIDEVSALGCGVELAPERQRCDELVRGCAYVVPSPGVKPSHPIIRAALGAGITVRSEIDLAAERFSFPIVAVSGTNGKTTTVEMITSMLRSGGLRVESGGNIGTPLISFVDHDIDIIVAEVSSFQLEYVTKHWHPRVAVLLNIADDHLDWHGTFDAYRSAKAQIARFQTPDDVLVVNIDDDVVRSMVQADALAGDPPIRSKIVRVTIDASRHGEYRVEASALRGPRRRVIGRRGAPSKLATRPDKLVVCVGRNVCAARCA